MTDVTDGSVVCADTSEVGTDLPATVPIATATPSVSLATVIYRLVLPLSRLRVHTIRYVEH